MVGAAKEPLPGWLDNINSPAAMWAAINMGVMRSSRLWRPDFVPDYVPVDLVTKATILAAWVTATRQHLA